MKEQIVSLETAKLAKEKGFNIIQRFGNEASLYDAKGRHCYYSNYGFMDSGLYEGYISAPTQALLQKLLREEHNISIHVFLGGYIQYGYIIHFLESKDIFEDAKTRIYKEATFKSYEESLESALQKALPLI